MNKICYLCDEVMKKITIMGNAAINTSSRIQFICYRCKSQFIVSAYKEIVQYQFAYSDRILTSSKMGKEPFTKIEDMGNNTLFFIKKFNLINFDKQSIIKEFEKLEKIRNFQ